MDGWLHECLYAGTGRHICMHTDTCIPPDTRRRNRERRGQTESEGARNRSGINITKNPKTEAPGNPKP